MTKDKTYTIIKFIIALVWFYNGLLCKVFNLVPRHQLIVARILGSEHSELLTKFIGISEVVMSLWILSGFLPRINAIIQIVIIAIMNILEYFLAPDLLLWGRFNIVFASMFIVMISFNEFKLRASMINA